MTGVTENRRVYRQRRRAQQHEATRQRIVEAAVALHESVGDEMATVSAIADRAGVSRVTVYRHFPDEASLLHACTGHYLTQNPTPDPSRWLEIEPPTERLRVALTEIYGFHRRTERMMTQAEAAILTNQVLAEVLQPYYQFWDHVRDELAAAWGEPVIRAVIGLAVDFRTWKSLARDQGLSDEQIVKLFVRMVEFLVREG
jgi:AcrR family transcriptional regulator